MEKPARARKPATEPEPVSQEMAALEVGEPEGLRPPEPRILATPRPKGRPSKGEAGGPTPLQKLSVMIPADTYQRLEALALLTRKGKNQIVREALEPLIRRVRLPFLMAERDDDGARAAAN